MRIGMIDVWQWGDVQNYIDHRDERNLDLPSEASIDPPDGALGHPIHGQKLTKSTLT